MSFIELEGANNVRDLGGIAAANGRTVRSGLLFRGGALSAITARDKERLFGDAGISRIVDLRCGWEREAKPDVAVPGVENLHIPFFDQDIVGVDYHRPLDGTVALGNDFACDPDDFYRAMPNRLTAGQMRRALEAIFEYALAGRPVYFHCSGGKDRCGIMALLVLTALGANDEAILEDYLLTNIAREKDIDRIYERFLRIVGDPDWAREITWNHRARPENLAAFREAVNAEYGSMASFMSESLGITDARAAELRAALTCSSPSHCEL